MSMIIVAWQDEYQGNLRRCVFLDTETGANSYGYAQPDIPIGVAVSAQSKVSDYVDKQDTQSDIVTLSFSGLLRDNSEDAVHDD